MSPEAVAYAASLQTGYTTTPPEKVEMVVGGSTGGGGGAATRARRTVFATTEPGRARGTPPG